MNVIRPLENEPLTFWFCAGDILWRGASHRGFPQIQPIDRIQAESLLDLYNDEVNAAWNAGEVKVARHAARMWRELVAVLDCHDDWKRLHMSAAERGRAA